MFVDKVQQ